MSSVRWAVGVLHPCLASPARSIALAEARLTDRRKVAALLEGAVLVSLLDRAGWRLAAGWEGALLSAAGPDAAGAGGAHQVGGGGGSLRNGASSWARTRPLPAVRRGRRRSSCSSLSSGSSAR